MKTDVNNTVLKSRFLLFAIICLISAISLTGVNGQEARKKNHDYLMPQKGKSMVELILPKYQLKDMVHSES